MNKLQRLIAAGIATTPLLLGIPSCERQDNETDNSQTQTIQIQRESSLRKTILSYLSQPKFSSSNFMEQITGTEAKLEILDLDEGMIYLSIPENRFTKELTEKLTTDPSLVEFGKTVNGHFSGKRIQLGDYVLSQAETYFFRFPSDNFRVNETSQIAIPYKGVNYSMNMQELKDFATNKSIFGGPLYAQTELNTIIANHGAFVAKRGETSLERLVVLLTREEKTKEEKAQKLLDFVTEELKYDYSDTGSNLEVLKRPNEVLMTRGSDCSGKVILYASLLEQTNIDYRLIYTNGHITVAVEGNYGNNNGLSFNLGNTTYSIAETTTRGFHIGHSIIDGSRTTGGLELKDIRYIQKPSQDSKIYNAKTGKALPFL